MTKIEQTLLDIGVPAHLSGFKCLTDAVGLVEKNPAYLRSITKELYPKVALLNGSNSTRVERAMRHAIEASFDRNRDPEAIKKYFGNTISANTGKVTNAEFIAIIAMNVRDWEGV